MRGHWPTNWLETQANGPAASPPSPLTSDRRFLVLEELVPNETHDETRLPHRRVSEQDELEVAHSPRRHVAGMERAGLYPVVVVAALFSLPRGRLGGNRRLLVAVSAEPPLRDKNLWLRCA